MGVDYKPVIWNRNKYIYDAVLIVGVILYILVYLRVGPGLQDVSRPLDGAILRMRAFGSCAFILLTIILCIGPLARLDRRFLPLLYNRRHMGVITATVAAVHANYVLGWYFVFTPVPQFEALLGSNTSYGQISGFPFEIFGVVAILILFVLATTSHDFWLSFLTPPVWKTLHMGIYFAYASVVLHVALGPLQGSIDPVFTAFVALSVITVSTLHFITGRREFRRDRAEDAGGEWIVAGDVGDIEENRAIIHPLADGERVAIFKYNGKLSAIHNACAHQNGPLGEGRILGGCVTCPWHGFQYDPANGRSPPPFTEKVPTYRLKLDGATILLDPKALPPGTPVEPVVIGKDA